MADRISIGIVHWSDRKPSVYKSKYHIRFAKELFHAFGERKGFQGITCMSLERYINKGGNPDDAVDWETGMADSDILITEIPAPARHGRELDD